VKGSRTFRDAQGRKVKQTEYFLGYKAHCGLNAESGLITSLIVTPGNVHDGHQLPQLLQRDLAQDIPLSIVSADRGYNDGDNHFLLQCEGLHSAIRLNDYRTQKKDPNKQIWLELKGTAEYQAGLQERYKIERKFGEAKQSHGLRRCRYVGLLRYGLQALLTAIALNLKRMVKLLTGVAFKEPVRVPACVRGTKAGGQRKGDWQGVQTTEGPGRTRGQGPTHLYRHPTTPLALGEGVLSLIT